MDNSSTQIPAFSFKHLGAVFKKTFKSWNENDPFRQSAVVAYYALFSLPALLVLVINIAGAVYGEQAVQGQINKELGAILGQETVSQIQTMISKASQQENSFWASLISIATLIFGSTGAFFQLQKSLNIVWNVKQDPKSGIKKMLFDRATAFGMVLVIAFLLLISFVLTAVLSAISDWITNNVSDYLIYVFYVANFLLSFGIITILFALIFKVLPDVKIPWNSVWQGAILTAALFVIAKFALGLYFGQFDPGSTYGAAGSIVLILLWISYSCMLLFFGAEFTRAYTRQHGLRPKPSSYAIKVKEEVVST